MKKDLKYLTKRIFKANYLAMFKIAKSLSKKAGKSTIAIVLDMINCGLVYEAGYYDYQEFEFYNLNKEQRKIYLTRGKNNRIIKTFNDKTLFHMFDNKIEFNKIFNCLLKRDWIVLSNNEKDFEEFFKKHIDIIAKPVDGEGGKGVEKYTYSDTTDVHTLYNSLVENRQLLIEDCIKQHPDMSKLYGKSVNTLRMFTFFKEGKSYFLQAILKVGNGGVIDNFSSGGMYTFVDDNGVVIANAIDRADNIYEFHPVTGEKIIGFKVPMFEEAVNVVKEAALYVPGVRYVGWDVAISENGPVIVEGNCFPGVFQVKPSLSNGKKEGAIPRYNEVMNIF